MEPLLRAENLSKVYGRGEQRLVVFEGLELELAAGEMVAIIGESGSGKSTLLHMLSGLDRPSEGEVRFRGEALFARSEEALARFRSEKVGYVWQFHYLLPEFTALENVMMPLLIAGAREEEARRLAGQWLEQVGLGGRQEHRSGELSGGEQQRVALARALVSGPELLMADEPTGNLDERTGELVFQLLQRLHQEHGLTSILVTHNVAAAQRCDRVLRLRKGKLEAVPSAGGVVETAELRR